VAEGCTGEDADVLDKAEVNLAMIRVQTHEDELAERGLREVLLRSTNDDVIRLAAHCLAKVLSHKSEHEKALRFARQALAKSEALGEPLKIHASLSLMGAVYANQSYLDEALRYYEQSLRVLDEHPLPSAAQQGFYRSVTNDSLGYVLVLMERLDEGLLHLEEAYETARALGITDLVAEAASDICFAYLRQGVLDEAARYGREGLEIAEAQGYSHLRRNCYYLLGEVASRSGDDAAAGEYFRKLGEFYPQVPFLVDFLREYDISTMINLKEFA
jgi:tetratricopeptide (TPR) repeat protein